MTTIDGYQGTIYATLDRETRIDVYRSEVWSSPDEVLDEFWENRLEIMLFLGANSGQYDDFDEEDGESVKRCSEQFQAMIEKFRANLKRNGTDEDDFEDIHLNVKRVPVHLSWLTDPEAARRLGIPVPEVHGESRREVL